MLGKYLVIGYLPQCRVGRFDIIQIVEVFPLWEILVECYQCLFLALVYGGQIAPRSADVFDVRQEHPGGPGSLAIQFHQFGTIVVDKEPIAVVHAQKQAAAADKRFIIAGEIAGDQRKYPVQELHFASNPFG